MPYITNTFSGKQMYRIPDRNYKKKVVGYNSFLILIIILDMYASNIVETNPHYLNVMISILTPVSWLFDALGVPITGGFLDGPQPPVYYHVLMLNSALFCIIWGVSLTYDFCSRCCFFRFPAYGAKLAQRNALKHPTSKIFANVRFFWIFHRVFFISVMAIAVVTIWHVYPGRVTFHVKSMVTATFISIIPAVICCLLPSSLVSFLSCLCCDIDLLRKRLLGTQ